LNVKVEQFVSKSSGRAVPNQFILSIGKDVYFQSDETIIAKKCDNGDVILDIKDWDYSAITARYRNEFLGKTTAQIKTRIKSGEYKLANLNK